MIAAEGASMILCFLRWADWGTRAAQARFCKPILQRRICGLAAVLIESNTSWIDMSVGKLDPRKTGLFVCDVQVRRTFGSRVCMSVHLLACQHL